MATKLVGGKIYGQARAYEGTLKSRKVLCSDVTFVVSINPVAYGDGETVFIDTEYDTWNMDPIALEIVMRQIERRIRWGWSQKNALRSVSSLYQRWLSMKKGGTRYTNLV